MISRREFLATTGAAVAASSVGAAVGDRSARLFLPEDNLKAATFDRLPLEWHKQRAQRLREKLAEDGYEGILLTDRWNIIYFTGPWHTHTERLVNVFLPVK
jgi:creatinase/prolidase-like protein